MAVEQRAISLQEKRRRAAERRYQAAKVEWTRATVRVWRGDSSVEAQLVVAAALAELNAARRVLATLEDS